MGVFTILGIHIKKSGIILNSSEIILNLIYGTENYHILCNFSEDNIYISFKINLLPIQVFVYVKRKLSIIGVLNLGVFWHFDPWDTLISPHPPSRIITRIALLVALIP